MEEKHTIKVFAVWSNEGFESIVNISEIEADMLNAELTGDSFNGQHPNQYLNLAILRARYNPQRAYEIYGFESTCDVSILRELTLSDPQLLVNLIREVGHCFFSSRRSTNEHRIV